MTSDIATMFLYYGLLVFCNCAWMFFSRSSDIENNRHVKVQYLSLVYFVLTFFMAMRGMYVGKDTLTYANLYRIIASGDSNIVIESKAPIYTLYCKLLSFIWDNPQCLTIANAIIINVAVAFFVYKLSQNIILSTHLYLVLYIYFNTFNVNRQILALALCLFAIVLGLNRKTFLFSFLLLILAIGIHSLIVLFAPIVILYLLRDKLNITSVIITIIIVGGFILFYWINSEWITVLFTRFFPAYSVYLVENSYSASLFNLQTRGRNLYLTVFLAFFVILAVYLCLNKQHLLNWVHNIKNIQVELIVATAYVFLGLSFYYSTSIARVMLNYSVIFLLLIPNVLTFFKQRRLLTFIIGGVFLIPFSIQLNDNLSGVVPYSFFFDT